MYRIHALLGDLPNAQRQAFVLNVLDAYDLSEIAKLRSRPETDLRANIEAARNQLRERLIASAKAQAAADQAVDLFAADST